MTRTGLAGTNSSGGLVVSSYAELPLLGAAPAAPAAGKARAYLDANGALQLLPAAGILGRRVAVHWGTGTAFPPLAAAGDTCVRSDVGTAGSLWQYTGIATSGAAGWVTESPIVCTSGTRPTGAVLYDGLPIFQTDDKASATWDVANTAWHVWDSVNQTFTPTFVTVGGTPAIGNGVLVGFYRRMGKLCWLRIYFQMGSTSNGGTGGIQFVIPAAIAAASAQEQWVAAKLYTNGNSQNWIAAAWLSGTSALPYAPATQTNTSILQVASANASGTLGTGVPTVSGQYTLNSGSNMTIEGVYEMNVG